MRATSKLLELIQSPTLLVMPAAYDAISAKLVEEAGFAAVQCSGLGICAAAGVPDFSILSMREMVEKTRAIAHAVNIPVMGDADTGYGSAVNAWHAIKEFEAAGAAGVNLEDQVFPKRCGRVDGKEIVSMREMALKIEAAAAARVDPDFVLNARTDALGLYGMEEAIKRANTYLSAGATMIFVTSVSTREQMKQLTNEIRGPVAINVMEQNPSADNITFTEMQNLGIARVSLTSSMMLSAMHGMRSALKKIREWDGTHVDPDVYAPLQDLQQLAGMPKALELERRYVDRQDKE